MDHTPYTVGLGLLAAVNVALGATIVSLRIQLREAKRYSEQCGDTIIELHSALDESKRRERAAVNHHAMHIRHAAQERERQSRAAVNAAAMQPPASTRGFRSSPAPAAAPDQFVTPAVHLALWPPAPAPEPSCSRHWTDPGDPPPSSSTSDSSSCSSSDSGGGGGGFSSCE